MEEKYVNANIKSIAEAVARLMNGETFFCFKYGKIYYLSYKTEYNNKFCSYFIDNIFSQQERESLEQEKETQISNIFDLKKNKSINFTPYIDFNSFSDWKIEKELKWHDNIPEQGILCRVADEESDLINSTEEKYFAIIKEYDERGSYPFRISEDFGWKFAIPVLLNDNILLENNN